MSQEIVHEGKITEINPAGFGYILEAEPMYRCKDIFVGETYLFDLQKIGFDYEDETNNAKIMEDLKTKGIASGTYVRFTLDDKGKHVTRVFPFVFRAYRPS